MATLKAVDKIANAVAGPANPDQVVKYDKRKKKLDQCSTNCSALENILKSLKAKYTRYKYWPSFIRYVLVKNMLKSAVDKYCRHVPVNYEQSTNQQVGVGVFLQKAEEVAKLMELHKHIVFADMAKMLSDCKKEILTFEHKIRTYDDNLKRLETGYRKSKGLRPIQRFAAMKVLIKDVISSFPLP